MGTSFLVTAGERVCSCTVAGYMNLLITRPHEDAQRLATPLEELGYRIARAPLLTMRYCPPPVWPNWSDVQGLLFTSANGVRALAQALRRCAPWNIIQDLPTLAVGPHTAETLKEYDFSSVACANGEWRALVEHALSHFHIANGRLLHVTGIATAGHVGETLTAQGYLYERLPLYDMESALVLPAPIVRAFSQHRMDGVVLCSSRTARTFTSLIEEADLIGMMQYVTAWCLSPAIATEVSPLPLAAVRVATHPNLSSLIDLLSQAKAKSGCSGKIAANISKSDTTSPETLCAHERTPRDVRHY